MELKWYGGEAEGGGAGVGGGGGGHLFPGRVEGSFF